MSLALTPPALSKSIILEQRYVLPEDFVLLVEWHFFWKGFPMGFSNNGKEGFPGRLIAVEGLDGSGKSTQIHLLKRWMELEGIKVFFTEWNSSLLVKSATKKGKKRQLLTPTTFSLIHATDFADRFERQVLPLLRAGYIVMADRYMYTAFARDVVRGCDPQWVRDIYSFAVKPHITFYFNVPLETALDRILSNRPKLKYHEAGMDLGLSQDPYESFRVFQGRIHQEYDKMTQEFGFTVINATDPIKQQQEQVRAIVQSRIDLPQFTWRHHNLSRVPL